MNRLSKLGRQFGEGTKYYERVKGGYLEYDAWIQVANGLDKFTAFHLDPEISNYSPPPVPPRRYFLK